MRIPDKYDIALQQGYYFDRAIDLELYKENGDLIAKLLTPSRGHKPSITVKGTLIEGSYAINSYISVQNLRYDINVNSVAYIKCKMYYKGIESAGGKAPADLREGHTILFKVIFADQEKEPPNRAVRFQCTVAAQDYTRFSSSAVVSDGSVDVHGTEKTEGDGKKNAKGVQIIEFLKRVAEAYNENLPKKSGATSLDQGQTGISSINYDNEFSKQDYKVFVANGTWQIGEIIRIVNAQTSNSSDTPVWNVYIQRGVIFVDRVPPKNWKDLDELKGKTEEQKEDWYTKTYVSEKRVVRSVSGGAMPDSSSVINNSPDNPVKLNYVIGAYRAENTITATTIFDDRIYPGCYVAIKGTAIMGKQTGRNTRITAVPDTVVFRVTGGLSFEFSTTERAVMTFQGPFVKELT